MAQVDLSPLIEQLDDSIDDLEEALAPLLKSALSDTAAKLPLLDRAKLYVLSTYAIESLIFCKIYPIRFDFTHLSFSTSISKAQWN